MVRGGIRERGIGGMGAVAFLGFLNSSSATADIAAHQPTGLETGVPYPNGGVSPDLTVYREKPYAVILTRLVEIN